MTADSLIERLWARFGRLEWDDIPNDVRTVATHCALDWFGCALAGSREPLSEILRSELATDSGAVSLIGSELRATPTLAALINGAAGHALDYDDTGSRMHPTAPVMPAVLAVAEERGLSGTDALTAFIVGYETEARIGSLMGMQHYHRGWHTTSTFGVFGAAAAVSRMLGLTEDQFGMAMGLAASQSSGVKANFGTMTKPFHAGHAAERGALSARLAARGYTANPRAFEANQGLMQAAGEGSEASETLDDLPGVWFLPETLFKYHAACYLTHSTINNVRRGLDGLTSDAVESMTIVVNPSILDVCGLYDRPKTGLEAKFSLVGTAAMAMRGIDTSNPSVFHESIIQHPVLQELMGKVRVETDPDLRTTEAALIIVKPNGDAIKERSDSGIPAEDLVEQEHALRTKFTSLVKPLFPSGYARQAEMILNPVELERVAQIFEGR